MPDPVDDDIDDDTLNAFEKVLKKYHAKDPKWLTTLFPDFSPQGSKPQASSDMTTLLQSFLTREEAKSTTLGERLEAALSVMTPEQLTQFRLATKGAGVKGKGSEGDGPKLDEPPKPPENLPKKKRMGWL